MQLIQKGVGLEDFQIEAETRNTYTKGKCGHNKRHGSRIAAYIIDFQLMPIASSLS
jgi:hypothetical protein